MRRTRFCSVYFVALTLGLSANLFVRADALGEPRDSGDDVGDEECCISVRADTPEEGEALGVLRIGSGRPGNYIVPFRAKLLTDLKDKGFEPEVECFRLEERVVLEGVWKIVLGSKGNTGAARPALGMFRREGSSAILFLDHNLASRATVLSSSGAIPSPHGEYAAIFEPAEDFKSNPSGRWNFYDRSGQKLWSIGVPILYEDLPGPGFSISASGRFAMYEFWPRLKVHFYDKGGQPVGTHALSEGGGDYGAVRGSYSDNGRHLAVHLLAHGGGNEVVFYDAQGDRMWRFVPDIRVTGSRCIATSPDGSYVILSHWGAQPTEQFTYVLDRTGSVIRRVEGFGATRVKFSSSGEYAGLFNQGEGVVILRLQSGETVFQYKPPARSQRDFDFAADAGLVAFIDVLSVTIVDFRGNRLWRIMDLPRLKGVEGAAPASYKVSLSENGEELTFTVAGEFYAYRHIR
ncbi:MAG: hypothetical protein ACE5JA_10185 [bacterium]